MTLRNDHYREVRKPDAILAKLLPAERPHPGTAYVPSQFALSFAHKGKNYLFNTLTKQCLEGTLPATAQPGEGFDELIAARFLVPAGKDECAFYNQISTLMRAYKRKKGLRAYTVLPTLGCNARCVYCYEEGMQQVSMTPETVEQTIRFILDTRESDRVDLAWFGGEPLLRTDVIDRICEALREAGLRYRSSMTSNGSLVTPEIVAKMKHDWQLKRIQISMDGAEEDYVSRKNYLDYQGWYHKVMNAASMLSEAGIAVTIRCNVDKDNWDGIPRFLDDLKAGVAHKRNVSVYFCPLNDTRMSDDDVEMWTKIRDARPLIEAAGFHAAPFMGLSLDFRICHCMADGSGVVIVPDGSLYPCEHCPAESLYGDIWHGTTNEAAKQAFCRVDQTREKCRTCPFLPNCTSFATCPAEDLHCREVYELMGLDALKRMVESKEATGGETPIC